MQLDQLDQPTAARQPHTTRALFTLTLILYHAQAAIAITTPPPQLSPRSSSGPPLINIEPLDLRRLKETASTAAAAAAAATAAADATVAAATAADPAADATAPPAASDISWFHNSALRCRVDNRIHSLLTGADSLFWSQSTGDCCWLSFENAPRRRDHTLNLGTLKCERILAFARTKRWWMSPSFGSRGEHVPPETQLLLLELGAGAYAVLLPLVAGELRCTLRGSDDNSLSIEVSSGSHSRLSTGMGPALLACAGRDPYALVQHALGEASARLGTFELASRKSAAADLDQFGWCTWDAWYQHVDAEGVHAGIASLHAGGTPARTLILDDGWQSVHDEEMGEEEQVAILNDPAAGEPPSLLGDLVSRAYRRFVDPAPHGSAAAKTWSFLTRTVLRSQLEAYFQQHTPFVKRLSAFSANRKFEDPERGTTLKGLLDSLRARFGLKSVYCWHTLGGYWGGVSTTSDEMAHLAATTRLPQPSRSLLEVEPALAWDPAAIKGVGVVAEGRHADLYRGLHSYLAAAGVNGVKVDGQSGLGPFGGADAVAQYVREMEASVMEHFSAENCINCMCHSSENLFSYRHTSWIRAADDFYPREPASHPVHLSSVAYNSLFLGELGVADWDMFQSAHPDAAVHAAARAVGGCPVYVSDKPGDHSFELLRKLVLPDGSVLRCQQAGRPTRDCLFSDPNTDGTSALKIFNVNRGPTAVVAAFNLQGARWDRRIRAFVGDASAAPPVTAVVRPSDVEGAWAASEGDEVAFYGHRSRRIELVAATATFNGEGAAVTRELAAKEWEIFTAAPVRQSTGVRWAAFGLVEMLNGGGAVVSSKMRRTVQIGTACRANARLSAAGDFAAFCSIEPAVVYADGERVPFEYDAESMLLRVRLERSAEPVELVAEFARLRR